MASGYSHEQMFVLRLRNVRPLSVPLPRWQSSPPTDTHRHVGHRCRRRWLQTSAHYQLNIYPRSRDLYRVASPYLAVTVGAEWSRRAGGAQFIAKPHPVRTRSSLSPKTRLKGAAVCDSGHLTQIPSRARLSRSV